MNATETTSIGVEAVRTISSILQRPGADALEALVLAHGAGAGMAHPSMAEVAGGLAARGIATLRFNFSFAEVGSKRPDKAPVARAAVRAAVEHAGRFLPGVPLVAVGKSFGGRMTSQAQAEAPLPAVRGLVFLGFPLHPAGKPSIDRAAHLAQVEVPMLFVSGDRDNLAGSICCVASSTRCGHSPISPSSRTATIPSVFAERRAAPAQRPLRKRSTRCAPGS